MIHPREEIMLGWEAVPVGEGRSTRFELLRGGLGTSKEGVGKRRKGDRASRRKRKNRLRETAKVARR